MKKLLITLWITVIVTGAALWYWFMYGSWRTPDGSLLEHDLVRFGPIPLLCGGSWIILFLGTLLLPCKGFSKNMGHKK